MAKKSKFIKVKVARDASTGKFISKEEAKRRPRTTIVQTIKRLRETRAAP